MKHILRQASSFIPPILFCIVIPYFLVTGKHRVFIFNPSIILVILGALICLAGLLVFILTTRMIILIGKGTIMPWDPTRKLVVAGIYQYVRNPMILSVIMVEAGEALLFASIWLGLVALIFFVINHVYFILSEEPGLEKRCGEEYTEYKKNVPRWIPRLKPWKTARKFH
jgi:protein-S-isoprenylcysteine O-methyltransferase Ste14